MSCATRRSIAGSSRGDRRERPELGLGTRAVIASPIQGPEGNREFLVHLQAGPSCAEVGDRIDEAVAAAWGAGRGGRARVSVGAHRVRVQPDDRAGDRAQRAGGRLVPDARRRPVGDRGRGRHGGDVRAARPSTDVLVVLGRRRHVPARGPGGHRRRRADPRHQPRPDRVPLEGRDRRARVGARAAPDRRVRAPPADGPRGRDPARRAARRPAPSPPSTTSSSPAARSHASSGCRSRSTSRTSPRSSPTASSCPARPDRPATRSRPAARSSTRTAATSS